MSESALQTKVLRLLKSHGIYCLNLYGDARSGKGKPDIIACINGKFVAFELKVGKNGLQEDQKIHRSRIIKSGGLHFVPRSVEEVEAILKELE